MFHDFLPTAAAIADVKPPRDIDGVSVVPALLGTTQKPHEFLYWELQNYDWNTMEFKKEIPMQAVRMGQWKAVRPKPDGPLEFYNLSNDAG
jgi:arylsulfatase A-like enzyme